MPTYRMMCEHCHGEFEMWNSIHDPLPERHDAFLDLDDTKVCNGKLVQVITGVRTYGVGDRGAETRSVDARERQIDKDRPAYKRLRDEGHQPRSMMGSHELEAKATDDWYIKTGGLVSVPDHKKAEVQEALATGAAERWSPVEQVHAKRSA